ncbi:hypothetical protein RAM19_00605 [Bartonella apihabitans]|nr:hypothetical protein [uncultured Bartonella sp.]WLT08801.1 hypothetical protein RAM19_00605 [Bartonella apihabitans]
MNFTTSWLLGIAVEAYVMIWKWTIGAIERHKIMVVIRLRVEW